MAESTTKSSAAKSSAKTAEKAADQSTEKTTDDTATKTRDTGADHPMTSTDGEKRPAEFEAGQELYESATWKQTHGTNPHEETKLSDF